MHTFIHSIYIHSTFKRTHRHTYIIHIITYIYTNAYQHYKNILTTHIHAKYVYTYLNTWTHTYVIHTFVNTLT